MAIIALSGKKQSGKDTVGKIIQILIDSPHFNNEGVEGFLKRELISPSFRIKKFADSLKDIMCILIGCTREQLEDEDFKNKELPEQWWYYKISGVGILPRGYYPNKSDNEICEQRYLVKPTPRLLLQLMGTECGRNILHPELWVNSLFSQYKENITTNDIIKEIMSDSDKKLSPVPQYPNWIITDMRFPNELKAVEDRGGITIRVERDVDSKGIPLVRTDEHISETALDNASFKHIIDNNCGIKTLIELVRRILIEEKLIPDVSSK